MRRLAVALALIMALPASAQGWGKVQTGWTKISNSGYAAMPAPSGCVAGSVALFLGSPVAMGCDAALTYTTATLAAPVHSGTTFVAAAPATITITGATNATPVVVTATAHGLRTNDRVSISGITGNTNANGYFKVTRLTADTFSLQNYSTGADIAGNGAYGGTPVAVAGIVQANRVLVGDGTEKAPSFSFVSQPQTGFRYGTDFIYASINGTSRLGFGIGSLDLYYSAGYIGINGDTYISRPAAATLQLGAANAASPVGQRLRSQGAATGTDIAGADLSIGPGNMTGTGLTYAAGRNGALRLQTYVPGTTGTTASTTSADRLVMQSTPITLTESSATPVLDYAVASGTVAGGTVWYTIRANDATNFQSLRGQLQWAAVNKGGTLTVTTAIVGTEITAASSGTLTNTATITTGTNSITINLNAVSSLTQTTLYAHVTSQSDGTGLVTTK